MNIEVYTDGAAIPNPGRGGWAAVFVMGGAEKKTITGAAEHASNNQMELRAAIEAIKAFSQPSTFAVVTDSQYVVKSMTEWIPKRGAAGYANADLFGELIAVAEAHTIAWRWVRAHNGNKWNERADTLAYNAVFDGAQCPECNVALELRFTDFDFRTQRIVCGKCGANFSMDALA